MRTSLLRSLAAAAAATLLATAAGTASAAAGAPSGAPGPAPAPGHWRQVTAAGLENFADIGLARGRDGVLHVLWTSGNTGTYRVADTPIAPNGTVGKTTAIASGLYDIRFPDATVTPGGLRAFWNGAASQTAGSPEGTYQATRPLRGGAWHVSPTVTASGNTGWDFAIAAASGKDGQPWVAFGDGGQIQTLHYGQPLVELGLPSCCVYTEGLGVDAKTGTPWLTYYSNMTNRVGIYAQQLTQAGTRAGAAKRLPGSNAGGDALSVNQRVAAASRGHGLGGVYTTYLSGWPTAQAVKLIRLGAKTATTISTFKGATGSTVASDPNGRLWVAWYRGHLDASVLFVRRSDTAARKFGNAHKVALPAGTSELWKVYLSAQAGRVDVLALLTVHGKIAYWATQLLPPK
jgi:hypothetical protein